MIIPDSGEAYRARKKQQRNGIGNDPHVVYELCYDDD
jgi:hypothetical protein